MANIMSWQVLSPAPNLTNPTSSKKKKSITVKNNLQLHATRSATPLNQEEAVPVSAKAETYKDIAEGTRGVWGSKFYETALTAEPCNSSLVTSYAQFANEEMRDADKAEHIYELAADECPADSDVHASYAYFLWHSP